MNAVIKGAKAGKGEARRAVIAPDSAQTKTYNKILYGLSEGEVEGLANGLQSVYLEETPLHDPNGGSNFQDWTAFGLTPILTTNHRKQPSGPRLLWRNFQI